MLCRRRRHVSGDEDGDNETVDSNNTRHNYRNQGLVHVNNSCSAPERATVWMCHTFIIRSGLNVPTPAIPMPDFAVPYAAPSAIWCVSCCCR